MSAHYRDAFGNVVREGDVVVWCPSGQSRLTRRRIVKVTYGEANQLTVTACAPGDEDRPATHRAINPGVTVIYRGGRQGA